MRWEQNNYVAYVSFYYFNTQTLLVFNQFTYTVHYKEIVIIKTSVLCFKSLIKNIFSPHTLFFPKLL